MATSTKLRIALAQIAPVVGAFDRNVELIRGAYERACAERADFLLTPELGLCGYPPHDLIERPEMFERNERALAELAAITAGKDCLLAVGHISANPSPSGRAARNTISVLRNGRVVFQQAKSLLPTYDVFDEARYFEPAPSIELFEYRGTRIAFAICEDLWAEDPHFGRPIYGEGPVERYREKGAQLVCSLSASPYAWKKNDHREELHRAVAKELKAPVIYLNQVGATDEILFDGGSFALGSDGKLIGRLGVFQNSFGVLEVEPSVGGRWLLPEADQREDRLREEIAILREGLVVGIREYFARTGFKTALIGLSGGIDSAVVAALAVEALGREKVLGLAMPSQYSSRHSLEDAEAVARNLGIPLEVRPIKFLYSQAQRELSEGRGQLAPVAQENLQSRLRGIILMTLSNHYNALVLTTGNKSELATGYCTLYGDMVGALAPIGDVFKTRIYELAREINRVSGGVIPESSITKAPSAELRPDQTDQDTLPAYDLLDPMLEEYLELATPVVELEKRFGSWVPELLRRVELNEYKRRQAAPALKVSRKAFGIGRRIPVAKIWDQ